MTELVVISGKGGTGKTSVVGSLASLTKSKVMVDCDVDASNLYLILEHKLKQTNDFIGGNLATINNNKCTGCGVCLDYCRFDAIKHENRDGREYFQIDRFACEGCGVCVHFCPEKAIDFHETIGGKWFLSDTSHGPLVHARLGAAQTNSGKLVSILREQAQTLAKEGNLDLIIIDGPPGVGCPVISSITGADYILIVTEPSMSALHDMKRLIELAGHFHIPVGLCINKHDINSEITKQIEAFALEKKLKILGKIPFDRAVIKAQILGIPVVEYTDAKKVNDSVRILWTNLENEL